MDQVLRQLTLYDFTGYLLPGIIVVWSLIYVSNAILYRQKKNHIKPSVFELIITGYIGGHLLQAIAAFVEKLVAPRFGLALHLRSVEQLYADDALFKDALKEAIKNTFGMLI